MDERINPEQIFHKNTRKETEHKKVKKEFVLKIPYTFLKWVGIIMILVLVFLAGRYSANFSFGNDEITGNITTEIVEEPEIEEIVEEEIEEPIVEEEPEVEEETITEEKLITTYTKVELEINSVNTVWKDTWGQITSLTILIDNQENGKIEPEYLVLHVEGYDQFYDLERIDLQSGFKSISAGKKLSGTVSLKEPFSYSDSVISNLRNVEVELILYDSDDKMITKTTKYFDLEG
jgi:hypothetical protein